MDGPDGQVHLEDAERQYFLLLCFEYICNVACGLEETLDG